MGRFDTTSEDVRSFARQLRHRPRNGARKATLFYCIGMHLVPDTGQRREEADVVRAIRAASQVSVGGPVRRHKQPSAANCTIKARAAELFVNYSQSS
jgi:hypothetical protein